MLYKILKITRVFIACTTMSVVPTYAQILLTQNLSNLIDNIISSLTIEEK
jgi:hypothetical protein